MAFTETWRREGIPAPEIEGSTGYNFARPPRLQRNPDGPTRGGIAIYVRDNITQHVSKGVSEIDTDPTNSLAVLRIARAAGFEKDLYLIVTYIVPTATQRTWSLLEDWVRISSAKGHVLVVGDQNTRTREDTDFPVTDLAEGNDVLNAILTRSVRRNTDPKLSTNGTEMLAMCKRTGLRIANGRVDGDKEGAFTFHSAPNRRAPNGGKSVVDNVLACPSAFPLISSLRFEPAAFSDHSAVIVQLTLGGSNMRQSGQSQGVPAPRAQRMMGAANIEMWTESILPGIADKFERLTGAAPVAAATGADAVHLLCQEFDDICAESLPPQNPAAHTSSAKRQPQWFDGELAQGRRAAQAALRRNPDSAIARQLQREYQTILRRKQRGFKRSQGIALVNLAKERNTKKFWQMYKTKKAPSASITKEQWGSHFSKLLGEVPVPAAVQQVRARSDNIPVVQRSADGSELNVPFTAGEVEQCVMRLRKGAATLGFLNVDTLRAAAPQLAPVVRGGAAQRVLHGRVLPSGVGFECAHAGFQKR